MSSVPESFYAASDADRTPAWRRSGWALLIVGLHVLLVLALVYAAARPEVQQPLRALAVRLLEQEPPPAPKIEPPKPQPTPAAPKKSVPPPVMATANATSSSSFAVAPQPEPVAALPAPAPVAVAPAPVTAARFDADYLQNPKPVYPPMSRRNGEEGKVVLRVKVSTQGLPLAIEIRQSSGFARLDEAARSAVERWKFVPAKQGSEAVESSVLVPLNFTLSN